MKKNTNEKKTTYFVIGGRGYLGSQLFSAIPNSIDKFYTSSQPGNGIWLDLQNSDTFKNIHISPGDIVFLTAAESAPDTCTKEFEKSWDINVTGTSNLIEHILNCGGRVIFFSSDAVYGEQPGDLDEGSMCDPLGDYGKMKRTVETLYANETNFKTIRLSYVFSKSDTFTRYLINSAESGTKAELYATFDRAVIHRLDVVEAVLKLAQNWDSYPHRIFNFGGEEVLSRVGFADALRHSVLPSLRYVVTAPPEMFFTSRAKRISMKSTHLPNLLGRKPRLIKDAALIEFNRNL